MGIFMRIINKVKELFKKPDYSDEINRYDKIMRNMFSGGYDFIHVKTISVCNLEVKIMISNLADKLFMSDQIPICLLIDYDAHSDRSVKPKVPVLLLNNKGVDLFTDPEILAMCEHALWYYTNGYGINGSVGGMITMDKTELEADRATSDVGSLVFALQKIQGAMVDASDDYYDKRIKFLEKRINKLLRNLNC